MNKEDIKDDLTILAFDFFYWFSRFEFALKENGVLKHYDIGSNAEPGWNDFIEKYSSKFKSSESSKRLITLNPLRQKIGENRTLEWKSVCIKDCNSELCIVVRLLKTIRNNLFHGGKHGAEGWDNPDRTKELLTHGISILNQFAEMTGWEDDYTRFY